MLVARLQRYLEERYDVSVPYSVDDFVSHDASLLQQVSGDQTETAESLLIQQTSDCLDVTLYLSKDTLLQARQVISQGTVEAAGFDSIGLVAEGVSHALCLFWHAHHDRQIRPVELELQAEIDKYLLFSRLLTTDQSNLHQHLFEQVRFLAPIGSELHNRYKTANDHAARYCRWLNATYMANSDEAGLKSELARFYRRSGSDKLQYTSRLL